MDLTSLEFDEADLITPKLPIALCSRHSHIDDWYRGWARHVGGLWWTYHRHPLTCYVASDDGLIWGTEAYSGEVGNSLVLDLTPTRCVGCAIDQLVERYEDKPLS